MSATNILTFFFLISYNCDLCSEIKTQFLDSRLTCFRYNVYMQFKGKISLWDWNVLVTV